MSSAALGGPAATTYAENTGVLALTRVYDPRVLQIGAAFAVLFGCSPKLAAILKSLPQGVLGGKDGATNKVEVSQGGKVYRPPHLSKDQDIQIGVGDVVRVSTPGGGGFGNAVGVGIIGQDQVGPMLSSGLQAQVQGSGLLRIGEVGGGEVRIRLELLGHGDHRGEAGCLQQAGHHLSADAVHRGIDHGQVTVGEAFSIQQL